MKLFMFCTSNVTVNHSTKRFLEGFSCIEIFFYISFIWLKICAFISLSVISMLYQISWITLDDSEKNRCSTNRQCFDDKIFKPSLLNFCIAEIQISWFFPYLFYEFVICKDFKDLIFVKNVVAIDIFSILQR